MYHAIRFRWVVALALVVVMFGAGQSAVAGPSPATAPAPPRIVNCADSLPYYYDQIDVWLYIEPGATGAWVYRSNTSSLAGATFIGGATDHGEGDKVYVYHDTSAQPFQTYYYWGRSVNSGGEVSAYSTDYAACSLDILPAPLNVNASDATATNHISVTWSAVSGAYDYKVYRADTSGGEYSYLGRSTANSYTDSTVERGRPYYYKVQACRQLGNCGYMSSYDSGSARIATPTGLQASQGSRCPEIGIQWNSVPYATSYYLYRVVDQSGTPAISYTVTTNYLIDTMVGQGITYDYWVVARNALSTSFASISTQGWVGTPPAVPQNVQASNDLGDKVLVTWQAVPGAATYKVWRAAPLGTYLFLSEPVTNSYSDTLATPGNTYYYKVSACYGACCSALSASDPGSRPLPTPTFTPITPQVTVTATRSPTPTCTVTPGPSPTLTRTPTPTKTVVWPVNHRVRLPLVLKRR
ncbi:MAG: hypothetical protein GX557_14495 [Chloroflexi bacterium]|nr:hypothetical protein [Chloroflexota bacterium]